ncbi:MAG TPA: CHAT domain-containing protein, partial [Thermoanaerobaculia bacterium]|nr:CHAT domain-containing protein [Thermoanaerobaculia bacterium]
RIVHLATHGFFLRDPQRSRSGVRGIIADSRQGLPGIALFRTPPENPLLRSGLALAGANSAIQGRALPPEAGNGMLLAGDVLSIDLAGTELVVLSACESGLGDVRASEGVYGLRRTFLLAGARTLVTTLWPIPDAATRTLMVRFYQAILAGGRRSEALRTAQTAVRNDPRTAHPFFWGAFVCVGAAGEALTSA